MPGLFLITYDITSPKRLGRLYRGLKKHAMPIQYSVFLARLGRRHLALVERLIVETIDPRSDDVRIYPLPEHGWKRQLGRPILPKGILLSLLPEEFRNTMAGDPVATAAQPASMISAGSRLAGDARRIASRARTGVHAGIRIIR